MKHQSVLAAVAASTVLGVAAIAVPANAVPLQHSLDAASPTVQWVGQADLVSVGLTDPIPTDGWFFLNEDAVTPTFGTSGMTIAGPGQVEHATTGSAATDLATIRSSSTGSLGTVDMISTGSAQFLLNIAYDATDTSGAELIATAPGEAGIDGTYTSQSDVGTIVAGTPATLAQFQTQIAATQPAATIADYGFFNENTTTTITGITYRGETTYFTPKPTATAVPQATTVSAIRSTGVTVGATGFLPGESVGVVIVAADGSTVDPKTTFTADAAGTVAGKVVDPSATAGAVAVTLVGETTGILIALPVTVAADPVVVAPAPVPTPVRTTASFTG